MTEWRHARGNTGLKRSPPLRILSLVASVSLLLCMGLLAPSISAQSRNDSSDAVTQDDPSRQRHIVQLSPHLILFDPHTTTATLEFSNPGDSVRRGQVLVQFAYWDRPHGLPSDTMIVDTHGGLVDIHDTVIARPTPTDHFAGRWLSGVPTTVTLAPHATKRVTVRIAPPPNLPAGEYWARIEVRVPPVDPHQGGARDVRQRYALPAKLRVPLLRDTCLVLYRQGPLTMGLAIGSGAAARIDSANVGVTDEPGFTHALWVRLPLHLTGNVPFRGMLHSAYRNLRTGEIVDPKRLEYNLLKDAVDHVVLETDRLAAGSWEYTIEFDNDDPDLPPALRLPMKPVQHVFRFEIMPAWQY